MVSPQPFWLTSATVVEKVVSATFGFSIIVMFICIFVGCSMVFQGIIHEGFKSSAGVQHPTDFGSGQQIRGGLSAGCLSMFHDAMAKKPMVSLRFLLLH